MMRGMKTRARQLGIGFTLVMILIAGGLAIAAAGTLMIQVRAGGKAAGIAQEEPKTLAAEQRAANAETRVTQLDSELSSAVETNRRNLASIATLNTTFDGVKKELDEIQRLQNENAKKTKDALAMLVEREKRQAGEMRRLRDIAAGPQVTITDGGLSEADTILRTAIRDMLGLRQP